MDKRHGKAKLYSKNGDFYDVLIFILGKLVIWFLIRISNIDK